MSSLKLQETMQVWRLDVRQRELQNASFCLCNFKPWVIFEVYSLHGNLSNEEFSILSYVSNGCIKTCVCSL